MQKPFPRNQPTNTKTSPTRNPIAQTFPLFSCACVCVAGAAVSQKLRHRVVNFSDVCHSLD
jgi:hypothetical protein